MSDVFVAMPKYETYIDSGVKWLNKIPKSWVIKRMKYLFKDVSQKGMPNAELLSVTQDQGVVPRTWVENRMVMPSGNLESFKFIHKGDFAISLRSFEGGLEYCHHDGIVSPAYTVLKKRLPNLKEDYYKYLFKSHSFVTELQTCVVGIREGKNVSFEELSYSLMPIPSELEQTAIANFLDCKTAQIDQAIAIKEKQIALLKERKQILIQNAVTRGLDPNVPMKDSGVEWIVEIPDHWEIVPMKRLANISPSIKVKNKKSDELVCFLPMEKVSVDGDIECDVKLPIKNVSQGFTAFAKNDVIVAKITPCFENGKSAYLENLGTPIGYGSTEFHVLRPSKSIIGQFLYYIVRSHLFLTAGEAMMTGSAGQKRVPVDFVSGFPVALPQPNEQKQIIEHIAKSTKAIEHAVKLQNKQIEQLKVYKSTLINSAVTGKIKVA